MKLGFRRFHYQPPILYRDGTPKHPGPGAVDAHSLALLEPPTMVRAHEGGAPVYNLASAMRTNRGKQSIALLSSHQKKGIILHGDGDGELGERGLRPEIYAAVIRIFLIRGQPFTRW